MTTGLHSGRINAYNDYVTYLIFFVCVQHNKYSIYNRTNEVTRLKEQEANTTVKEYERVTPPDNTTFTFSSYFSGIDLEPSKTKKYIYCILLSTFTK